MGLLVHIAFCNERFVFRLMFVKYYTYYTLLIYLFTSFQKLQIIISMIIPMGKAAIMLTVWILFMELSENTKYMNDDDADIEEDLLNEARNLMYVGMTRAKDMLYMFTVDGADGDPSPLIDDLDESFMEVSR